MIYILQSKISKCIKIGTSRTPSKRLQNLQTGSYEDLELLGYLDERFSEKEIKKRFKKLIIRGEWYTPAPILLDFINQNVRPRKNIVIFIKHDIFRIYFVEPVRITLKLCIVLGNYNLMLFATSDEKYILGVQGRRNVLIAWLNSLNISDLARDEFISILEEELT